MMETLIEQKLIAAATLIIRELDSTNKLSHKAKKRLVDLHAKLSSASKIFEGEEEEEVSDIEKQIDSINPDEVKEYLKEVEGLRRLVESLKSLNPSKDTEKHRILTKGKDVLRTSIHRIEGLFKRTLVYNRYNFVPTPVRFRSSKDDAVDDGVDPSSLDFFVHDSDDGVDPRSPDFFADDSDDDSISKRDDVYIMHLIDPMVIPELKSIAHLMFGTDYGRECSDAFISVRKDALEDLLFILEIEKSSIEEVLKMEQFALRSKIKRWTKAMKSFVRIYLASEKFLCEQIFGHDESISTLYISESSYDSISQFLDFAEAFTFGHSESERILMVLDVHDTLSYLTPDIKSFYPHENGSYLRIRFQDVLSRVGYYAGAKFSDFTNTVRHEMSNVAVPKGGIHPLTRLVMNYINTLAAYNNSLNIIFTKHGERDDQDSSSFLETSSALEDDNGNKISSSSPKGLCFQWLISVLESKLEEKSRLYKEDALGHLFLMNNFHYTSEKVKGSELRTILGDNWIREHNWKFQHYAMSYERSTWIPILKLLMDVVLNHSDSSFPPSKGLLKDRLQMFYTAFKEIYKSQTGWLIPNNELRQDLRISVSLRVILVFRNFIGSFRYRIDEKYIKYDADDLENYLLDLFEGSPASFSLVFVLISTITRFVYTYDRRKIS